LSIYKKVTKRTEKGIGHMILLLFEDSVK